MNFLQAVKNNKVEKVTKLTKKRRRKTRTKRGKNNKNKNKNKNKYNKNKNSYKVLKPTIIVEQRSINVKILQKPTSKSTKVNAKETIIYYQNYNGSIYTIKRFEY